MLDFYSFSCRNDLQGTFKRHSTSKYSCRVPYVLCKGLFSRTAAVERQSRKERNVFIGTQHFVFLYSARDVGCLYLLPLSPFQDFPCLFTPPPSLHPHPPPLPSTHTPLPNPPPAPHSPSLRPHPLRLPAEDASPEHPLCGPVVSDGSLMAASLASCTVLLLLTSVTPGIPGHPETACVVLVAGVRCRCHSSRSVLLCFCWRVGSAWHGWSRKGEA